MLAMGMFVHGMIVEGAASGDHYGPVAIGEPDERANKESLKLGRNAAAPAIRLRG